jgi:large subunit ribosomal protein L19
VFLGIVIAKKYSGISASFTVRRVVAGEGVERIFASHSPRIAKIDLERASVRMCAKLYYIRKPIGKEAIKVRKKGARGL